MKMHNIQFRNNIVLILRWLKKTFMLVLLRMRCGEIVKTGVVKMVKAELSRENGEVTTHPRQSSSSLFLRVGLPDTKRVSAYSGTIDRRKNIGRFSSVWKGLKSCTCQKFPLLYNDDKGIGTLSPSVSANPILKEMFKWKTETVAQGTNPM